MKRTTLLIAFLLVCYSTAAQAWFIFIPGIVFRKLGEAISGEHGENCVSTEAKLGDSIVLKDGRVMTVQDISGPSDRCTNPSYPIRATLKRSADGIEARTTTARIDIPEGWEQKPLTDLQKSHGIVLHVANHTIDAGLIMSTVKRSTITDMAAYAASRRGIESSKLQEGQQSEITQLDINGIPAWRFEVSGRLKSGIAVKYLNTVLEGSDEAIIVSTWTSLGNYDTQRDTLTNISNSLTGITPPDASKEATPSPISTSSAQ